MNNENWMKEKIEPVIWRLEMVGHGSCCPPPMAICRPFWVRWIITALLSFLPTLLLSIFNAARTFLTKTTRLLPRPYWIFVLSLPSWNIRFVYLFFLTSSSLLINYNHHDGNICDNRWFYLVAIRMTFPPYQVAYGESISFKLINFIIVFHQIKW